MRFAALTIPFLVLALAVAAAAEPRSLRVGPNKEVFYGDLDINTAVGAQILYDRIGKAARELCEFYRSMDSLYEEPFKSCYAKAVSESVAKADSAMVRQVHAHALGARR
jgi:UrcA family protein